MEGMDLTPSANPDYQSITPPLSNSRQYHENSDDMETTTRRRSDARRFIAHHASEGQNFTIRGIICGLVIGTVIAFQNVKFGLESGWISSMSMPSSLIGFAFFKTLSKHLKLPFTPVENVLVQTVAGSVGTMPLGCGLVGVMPAINYMLKPEEGGPILLPLWKLILWSLGLCFFGVVFAVPLRKQVIIREKLKFPSGTATAMMIGVLHGQTAAVETTEHPVGWQIPISQNEPPLDSLNEPAEFEEADHNPSSNWGSRLKLLSLSFVISGVYALTTYFVPALRNLPVFGTYLAESYLWTLNPSLAYIGQGVILGPAVGLHLVVGAVIGYGILSPLAKIQGWAPGPTDDWETGSKGWIVWVSLAIMLADSVVSLGYIALKPLARHGRHYIAEAFGKFRKRDWDGLLHTARGRNVKGYTQITGPEDAVAPFETTEPNNRDGSTLSRGGLEDLPESDAPPEHLVSNSTVWTGLILSILFCIGSIRIVFRDLIPLYATTLAVFMALILSIMGVRALGETDLNPVSGISKLAQLFFALIIPRSNKNSVIINLVAGAVSEAGALQAGDLMQDLKTGHLLGAAPNAQFWGQMIGSMFGAVVSALIYQLYTSIYEIPGDMFQVPTGYVWIFTARLLTGKGLPYMAWQWALGFGVVFTITTIARIIGTGKPWHPYIPGGIAVAIGIYNVPSFTLARAIGGFISWYWKSYLKREESSIIIMASGFILGEGVLSIVNVLLASAKVPHL